MYIHICGASYRETLVAGCVGTLCAGLKSAEGEFDIDLFGAECDTAATASVVANVDVAAVRQRWHGFPSPVLLQVEDIAIQAMLAHCGLLGKDVSLDTLEKQGVLLHIGKEALKIKRTVQDLYRAAAASETPSSWDDIGAGAIERARLILNHGGATAPSEALSIELKLEDSVFLWERENGASDQLCMHADKVRRFIQSDVSASRVTNVLELRLKASSEASSGYAAAVQLLKVGESPTLEAHRSSTEAWTLTAKSSAHPEIKIPSTCELTRTGDYIIGSGSREDTALVAEIFLKFDADADGKLDKDEYKSFLDAIGCWGRTPFTDLDYDRHGWPLECTNLQCDPSPDGGITFQSFSDVLYGRFRKGMLSKDLAALSIKPEFKLCGRVASADGTDTVSWTEMEDEKVCRRFEAALSDNTLAGSGKYLDVSAVQLAITGKHKSSEIGGTDQVLADAAHSAGISIAQRRLGLLLSLSDALSELGPLTEQTAQASSDALSEVLVELFCEDPSEQIRIAAGRLLLTRLDNGGTRYLAANARARQIVLQASKSRYKISAVLHDMQGIFVSSIMLKLARLSPADNSLLSDFATVVLDAMRAGDGPQHVRWMGAIRAACHIPNVSAVLHRRENEEYLWVAAEAVQSDTPTQACHSSEEYTATRLAALQLLTLTLQATADNLQRMLRLIVVSSPETANFNSMYLLQGGKTASVVVRVNASLALRKLCTDSDWLSLFCSSCNEAASLTAASLGVIFASDTAVEPIPIFAHLLVLGCLEVQGSSQPGDMCSSSDDMRMALRSCTTALQELLEQVMTLHESGTRASLEFCILRSRLMKVAFEISSLKSDISMLTTKSIAAVVDLAAQPTDGLSVEAILDQLHCIYPLGASTTGALAQGQAVDTDAKPSEAVPPMSASDTVEFPAGPLAVVDAQPDVLLQELQSAIPVGAVTQARSFVSTGSLVEAAADAERALASMLARLCVVDSIGSGLSEALSAQQVTSVLRALYLFVGGKNVVSPLFHAHPTLSIASVEKAVANYTEDRPAKLAALKAISLGLMRDEINIVTTHRNQPQVLATNPDGVRRNPPMAPIDFTTQDDPEMLRWLFARFATGARLGLVGFRRFLQALSELYQDSSDEELCSDHVWEQLCSDHGIDPATGMDQAEFEHFNREVMGIPTQIVQKMCSLVASRGAPAAEEGEPAADPQDNERSTDAAFNLWLADLCVRLSGSSDHDTDWAERVSTHLFVIWAHANPATRHVPLAVLARLPSTALSVVAAREPKLRVLLHSSLRRQWEQSAGENGGGSSADEYVLLPAYLQALFEVSLKADVLGRPVIGDQGDGSSKTGALTEAAKAAQAM